jgi:hypothetical protein
MDVSTQLVRAYLHVNGYFTATDYPLVESLHEGASRMITDVDMLAVRLQRSVNAESATHTSHGRNQIHGLMVSAPDTALGAPDEQTDMIIAEIKQGRAQVNPAAHKQRVVAAALTRFGCCGAGEAAALAETLLQKGRAQSGQGHVVRMILFASSGGRAPRGWHWIHIDHVFRFLDEYLLSEGRKLGGVDLHDPALAWLRLLHKSGLQLQKREPMA